MLRYLTKFTNREVNKLEIPMKQNDKDIKNILEKIRVVRKQKGLTQENVAHVIGVERSTYVRKESGDIPLTISELLKITSFLELSCNINAGELTLTPKLEGEIASLFHVLQSLPTPDKKYVIENTKKLAEHLKRVSHRAASPES